MKILILFTDMIRQNRLSVIKNAKPYVSEFDNFIKSLGGTYYTNCFTTCPDTPRSLATFYSGLAPQNNGCDTAVKWPQYFMNDTAEDIFKMFYNSGYKMDFLSDPVERKCGIFPRFVKDNNTHNTKYSIVEFFKKLTISEKHVIFACFPQFHWTLSAIGASTFGEKIGYKNLSNALYEMERHIDLEEFDHIFMFSDHGFKLSYETRFNYEYMNLNEDRTNVLFLHKRKGIKNVKINESLCSLTDFNGMICDLLKSDNLNSEGIELPRRRYITIEDHLSFNVGVTDVIERWALKTPNYYYIRNVDRGYIKMSNQLKFRPKTVPFYDRLLRESQSFENIIQIKHFRSLYTNMLKKDFIKANALYDMRQEKSSKIFSYFHKISDVFKKILGLI